MSTLQRTQTDLLIKVILVTYKRGKRILAERAAAQRSVQPSPEKGQGSNEPKP